MPTPRGWSWIRLTDIARLESGHTPSREHPEYWDGEIGWIGIKDARQHHGGFIYETLQKITSAGLANSSARLLPTGTVCLSRTASVGYTFIMGRSFATSQDFVNWVCGPAIDPPFLMYAFLAEGDGLRAFGKGTTHTTIYFEEVREFHVCVPPLAEQRRIVAKIESLMERSRKAREALDAIPPLLDRFRQSVLAAAFRGDLTADWREKNPAVEPAEKLLERIRAERRRRWEEAELAKMKAKGKVATDDRWKAGYREPSDRRVDSQPELPIGWSWQPVEALFWDAGYGTSEKCEPDGLGPPVLRIPNIARGSLDLSEIKRAVSVDRLDQGATVSYGDLLIVRTNGSRNLVGRVALIKSTPETPHLFASYLIRLRIVAIEALPEWVSLIWSSPQVREFIDKNAPSSAGQHNVSLGSIGDLYLPVPPASEISAIIRRVDSALLALQSISSHGVEVDDQLQKMNSAILAKAFRGELVPQDPADEPAAVLLNRIRAEREAAGGTSKKSGRGAGEKSGRGRPRKSNS